MGHTPGPLYAAPIRGAVLGFPELLKFLVASREHGWTAATLTLEDATLYAAAPVLLAACKLALFTLSDDEFRSPCKETCKTLETAIAAVKKG